MGPDEGQIFLRAIIGMKHKKEKRNKRRKESKESREERTFVGGRNVSRFDDVGKLEVKNVDFFPDSRDRSSNDGRFPDSIRHILSRLLLLLFVCVMIFGSVYGIEGGEEGKVIVLLCSFFPMGLVKYRKEAK